MKIDVFKHEKGKYLIKILRNSGKNEEPFYALKRQAIGLKLFHKLFKEIPEFSFDLEPEIIENYEIIQTLSIFIENHKEKQEKFNEKMAALCFFRHLLLNCEKNQEKIAFFQAQVKKNKVFIDFKEFLDQ